MSMEISKDKAPSSTSELSVSSLHTSERGVRSVEEASPVLQVDSVTVSQDARLLACAQKTAEITPDIRSERVQELRIQVQNGTYKPDSRVIAAHLVNEEPGLFRSMR